MIPAFIRDGYTERVGIDPVPGVHDGMQFEYRPFVNEEGRQAFREAALGPTALNGKPGRTPGKEKQRRKEIEREQSDKEVRKRIFETIVNRVSWWSFQEDPDDPMACTVENLFLMRGKLYERFSDIVFGLDTASAIPDYRIDDEGNRVEIEDNEAERDAGN